MEYHGSSVISLKQDWDYCLVMHYQVSLWWKQLFFIEVGFTSTFLNLGEQAMKKKYKLTKKLWDNNGRLRKDF